uniref:Uncharacterized protein n=1 Tax=Anguilla anguilla TaxID=7936 RepID=A0A0E9QVK5_ANGAN
MYQLYLYLACTGHCFLLYHPCL